MVLTDQSNSASAPQFLPLQPLPNAAQWTEGLEDVPVDDIRVQKTVPDNVSSHLFFPSLLRTFINTLSNPKGITDCGCKRADHPKEISITGLAHIWMDAAS